jgi:hypothetical protein
VVLTAAPPPPNETPVRAAGRGLLGGLAASLLLSVLARVLPGMGNEPAGQGERPGGGGKDLRPPSDPFDARQVSEWQARAQAPAGFRRARGGRDARQGGAGGAAAGGATPAGALTAPQAPGPEGLAEQFAFKIASGVFDRDVSRSLRPAGLATHLAYGSLWGALYGLLQASYRRQPARAGALYGLAVWLVGPAVLVPAMKLMRPPWEEPPVRTGMMVAGHVVYGLAVAAAFGWLEREAA